MKSIRFAALPAAALMLASCASQKNDAYDTANPYGAADASQVNPPAETAPANPIYDTPAAYEESTGVASAAPAPGVPADPAATGLAPTPAAPATAPGNGAAIIHTVEKGDTLSGLSAKYNVPVASIKAANRMTNDIVVLGRKMVIPPQ